VDRHLSMGNSWGEYRGSKLSRSALRDGLPTCVSLRRPVPLTERRIASAGGAWTGWESLGGYLTSRPWSQRLSDNRLEVCAWGQKIKLRHQGIVPCVPGRSALGPAKFSGHRHLQPDRTKVPVPAEVVAERSADQRSDK